MRGPARGAPARPRGPGPQPPPDPRSWPSGAAPRRSPGRTRPTPTLRETRRGLDHGQLTQTHEQHRLGDPLGHLPAQTQRRPLTSQGPFWRGACALRASRPARLRRAPRRGPARRVPAARRGRGRASRGRGFLEGRGREPQAPGTRLPEGGEGRGRKAPGRVGAQRGRVRAGLSGVVCRSAPDPRPGAREGLWGPQSPTRGARS